MKRKLFIGSSKEGLEVAKKLKAKVDAECGDWIETELWSDGGIFTLNKNALDSLLKAARQFDYGVLVATSDDTVLSRDVIKAAPRDNVLLEMGMFLGSLGLTRAFLLVEEDTKLPSDYNGVTLPFFKKGDADSLNEAIEKIVQTFKTTRNTYNLRPLPSAALALGYFENFVQVAVRKKHEQNTDFKINIVLPKNILDINAEKRAYIRLNPSTEKGIGGPDTRPIAFEYTDMSNNYWDMPSTLSTLNKLMDMLLPTSEIGVNQEKQNWIDSEIRNFAGTLKVLVEQCADCRGYVNVQYLQ